MGKIQSKQKFYRKRDGPEGECFVVNAHFNPMAVADYEDAGVQPPPRPNSELSLCLDEETKAGFAEDKYPLQVVLPPEEWQEKAVSNEVLLENETRHESRLNLEQFECDVSVNAESGVDRQEFVFTLYDFDGHGKITKDDIAGLVKSIYDAVGSTVKLPPSGSKTIKVRLTVAPDKRQKDEPIVVEGVRDGSAPNGVNSPKHPGRKPRPTTFYRQNLMDVIQGNVFDKLRTNGLNGTGNDIKHRPANNRDTVIECRDRRNHYLDLAGIENYSSRFNDKNTTHKTHTNCPYQLDESHVCPKSHLRPRNTSGHHRSKSHDLTMDSILLRYQLLDQKQMHKLALVDLMGSDRKWTDVKFKSPTEMRDCVATKSKGHQRKSFNLNGHSSSPHHHKHRHREREHQRAMQQVASWIEREHLGMNASTDRDRTRHSNKMSPLLVERHEHHHVHEHVHHHHHHYNEV